MIAEEKQDKQKAAGLCGDCYYAQKVISERGSTFTLCRLSLTDSRFDKYPRLPVIFCNGYLSSS